MTTNVEQLIQLKTATWDGNLFSKEARDKLVKVGLVDRDYGFNWLTRKGVEYLVNLGLLTP